MKFTFIIFSIILLFSKQIIAQSAPMECKNDVVLRQADSLKNIFLADEFSVVRESPLKMESQYELPIIVQLKKGMWYHFILVGDKSSKLFEVVMYDWDENKVFYEKNKKKDIDGNIISFSFIPTESGYFNLRPVQINKKENNLCGYFIMMNKIK